MQQKSFVKSVLLTIMWTILCLIILTTAFFGIWCLGFPKSFGDFVYNLGNDTLAMDMYYRAYEKDDNVLYCYKALNLSIKTSKSDKIVKYYEEFISNSETIEFLDSLKEYNENKNIGVLEKSTLLNEMDYLTNKYIVAVASTKGIDEGWNLTVSEFSKLNNATFKNQGVYALNEFLSKSNLDKFTDSYEVLDATLISAMQNYFDKALGIFNENINATDNVSKAYLFSLGRRIICVGDNIKYILSETTEDSDAINEIQSTILSVNETIKGLL